MPRRKLKTEICTKKFEQNKYPIPLIFLRQNTIVKLIKVKKFGDSTLNH